MGSVQDLERQLERERYLQGLRDAMDSALEKYRAKPSEATHAAYRKAVEALSEARTAARQEDIKAGIRREGVGVAVGKGKARKAEGS